MKRACTWVLVLLLGLGAQVPAQAAEKIISIGTGSITGVYYPAGGALCRLLNRDRKVHGVRCFVESTGGSIYNIHALRDGEIDFGIAQSDWQYSAYRGEGLFADGPPFRDLRSIFSLHSEMFTLVVGKDSNIRKFADLKGKRVNIGDRGSGMRATMQELMEEFRWTKHSFTRATEMKPNDAAQALCAGKIDAMVFTAGHPNGLVQEVTANCDAVLVPVEGKEVDRILANHAYYAHTVIPGSMYKNNAQETPTFGVKATLVTTAKMDNDAVYRLTKAVFDNLDTMKTLHFVFARLEKERMISAGLTAPLHPGAVRYYREAGLLKEDPPEVAADPEPATRVRREPLGMEDDDDGDDEKDGD